MASQPLRRGDLVEIRSPREILATLDGQASVEGMPFMPEMVAWCGRRMLVDKIADKICDSAMYVGGRRLPNAVLLADQRCDGSGHEGCQARCRMFWKNVWLRKLAGDEPPAPTPDPADVEALMARVTAAVRHTVVTPKGEEPRYRCQLTELHTATEEVRTFDPNAYIGQYTNGNVSLGHCIRVTARAAIEEPLRKLGLMRMIYMQGSATGPVDERLDLQPGEWVQVKSEAEILATLTPRGTNRGMWFDREMTIFCGKTYRVEQRITRIIDDVHVMGRLVDLKTDAVTLEGVYCSGDLSMYRWFCPRKITPYWRECWLKRVPAPSA